jgi:hypothetical protein
MRFASLNRNPSTTYNSRKPDKSACSCVPQDAPNIAGSSWKRTLSGWRVPPTGLPWLRTPRRTRPAKRPACSRLRPVFPARSRLLRSVVYSTDRKTEQSKPRAPAPAQYLTLARFPAMGWPCGGQPQSRVLLNLSARCSAECVRDLLSPLSCDSLATLRRSHRAQKKRGATGSFGATSYKL